MILADETPVRALCLEAHITAGKALRKLGQFFMAQKQIEKALSIDPENLDGRQERESFLVGSKNMMRQKNGWKLL